MNTMNAADRAIMKRFIWGKIYPNTEFIILANGEDGPLVAEILPLGDDPKIGIDLEITTNEPDAVKLKEIYQYYRRQDMTWEEWSVNVRNEHLARQYQQLSSEITAILQRFPSHSRSVPEIISVKKPRLSVDVVSGTIELDGTIFAGIDYEGCLIVKVLVNAKGNWVSRSEMQAIEPHLQVVTRIDRKIDHLQEHHQVIGALIERRTKGFRIKPHIFD